MILLFLLKACWIIKDCHLSLTLIMIDDIEIIENHNDLVI